MLQHDLERLVVDGLRADLLGRQFLAVDLGGVLDDVGDRGVLAAGPDR